MLNLTFLGAAREVTGSCILLETAEARFLVDCGMVQGGRAAPERNRRPFAFDPATVDFVLLSHAHIDHSGLLPKLTRDGFEGPIYATEATADLLGVMLPDSARIHESEAERARRYGRPVRGTSPSQPPLYTQDDARGCLAQVRGLAYDREFFPHPTVRCRFRDAGHILGSAIIEVWITENGETTKVVFSGDLGQPGRPILSEPTPVDEADILVIESTYGDRNHKTLADTRDELLSILHHTLRRGNLIVPAFAVGRTQELLYYMHQAVREGRADNLRIFVDSPMATEVTRITQENFALFNAQARDLVEWHRKDADPPFLRFTVSVEDSKALSQIHSGAIIISASGMCDAGRIRHHLRHNLPRRECAVLITGFQAQGTLGRSLVDGARTVRLFGETIPVRASVHTVDGLSAHADRRALLGWTGRFRKPPRRTFVVHGEAGASMAFAEALREEQGWDVVVPEAAMTVRWDAGAKEWRP